LTIYKSQKPDLILYPHPEKFFRIRQPDAVLSHCVHCSELFVDDRMEKRHNYVRKVAEVAVQLYISNDKPNISGIKYFSKR
jgi:hypothetical protein